MNNPGQPSPQNPLFPTETPNTGPPLPEDNIKSAGPPKPVIQPQDHDSSSHASPTPSPLPTIPRMPAGSNGGAHYSGNHIPNQHPDGPRAPIPVSREPWERPTSLDALFFKVGRLRRNSAHFHNDAEWPELEAELQEWLWKLFDDYKRVGMQPKLWYDIGIVRFHLHLNPLPREMMVWHGPEQTHLDTSKNPQNPQV
jgi:hypothetical protein